ncbi:hypothetical protein [Larkinella soli]|uniref:hypothetical protein n=1 Tax=Larkinella soli TaxID=1770527 RepID=UPI000FFBBEE9|nr:hypothetical protein [Larkinella soli]
MKKTIIALVTLALLTTGGVMAQRPYDRDRNPQGDPRYDNPRYDDRRYDDSRYGNPRQNERYDDYQEDLRIDRLDAIVGLTRRQERDLKRIEDRYDYRELNAMRSRSPYAYQRTLRQKRDEMMSVLTPFQRDRLFAYYQSRRGGGYYGRRG